MLGEEEKSTEIPLVVASERKRPNREDLFSKLVDSQKERMIDEWPGEGQPQRVIALVVEKRFFMDLDPEYHGTRETLWKQGDHPPSLNTT